MAAQTEDCHGAGEEDLGPELFKTLHLVIKDLTNILFKSLHLPYERPYTYASQKLTSRI